MLHLVYGGFKGLDRNSGLRRRVQRRGEQVLFALRAGSDGFCFSNGFAKVYCQKALDRMDAHVVIARAGSANAAQAPLGFRALLSLTLVTTGFGLSSAFFSGVELFAYRRVMTVAPMD